MDESHIESLANLPADLSIEQKILVKYRKYVALVLPFVVAQVGIVWHQPCLALSAFI